MTGSTAGERATLGDVTATPAAARIQDTLVDAIVDELIAERDAARGSDGGPGSGRDALRFSDFQAAASRARGASGRR